ncbi:MAG: twin-arginine translocase TatA/TatE family subunit [Armatimonadota bacterium]
MFPLAAIGTQEIIIIVGAIALLFGVKKLPEMGRSLAEGIQEFKKASREAKASDSAQNTTDNDNAKESIESS